MAQPYLSFRELQQRVPDRTGEFYGSAIKSVGEAAGSLISDYKQAKENDLKGIYDPRKDINETVNRAHRSMALKDWGAFKDKWLPITQNQRARLSPDQLLQQRTDVEDLQKEAEYYNIQSKYMDAARKKADGIYTSFDQESMDKVMEAIDKGDKDAYMEATSGAMKTNSGTPFLKINPIDSDKEIGAIFDKLAKDREVSKEIETTEEVDGNLVTRKGVYSTAELDPEQQRASVYATINTWKPEKRMAVESDLAEKMTAEEQTEADALFPNSATPLTMYNLEKRGIENEVFVKKSVKTRPVSASSRGKGLRLNFGGGDSADYDSNRTDFTVEGREYKDAFTFPEYATKERIDVVKDASMISGKRKDAPKDITEVGRLVLYDMDRDIIVVQDKDGAYYEAPRSQNSVILRKLIDEDDYAYIDDYQSKREPTTEEPLPTIKRSEFGAFYSDLKSKASDVEDAKSQIEALYKDGRISATDKRKAISDLSTRKTKRYFKNKPATKTESSKEEQQENNTGGLY